MMEPFPAMDERFPSAVLIFWHPEEGKYDENMYEELVIWSVAPESMIQGSGFSKEELKAVG